MERMFVCPSIPDLTGKTLKDLTLNQVGLRLYNVDGATTPIEIGNEVTTAQIQAAVGIQFIQKTSTDYKASVVIPNKQVINRNYKAYVAGVAGVVKLGNNAASASSILVPDTGEGTISLIDMTDPYVFGDQPISISITKKLLETPVQYLTRVVAAINNDPGTSAIVTAALQTATGFYQIQLTTTSYKVKLGVFTDGIFDPYAPINVTTRVIAVGTGEQVQAREKRLTVFDGNGNYMENGDLYFSEPVIASLTANYNAMSLTHKISSTPSASTTLNQGTYNIEIFAPSGDTTLKKVFDALSPVV